MRTAGRHVLATDLYPRAPDVARLDFLHQASPSPGCVAVTNPPFNRLDAFMARGLALLDAGEIAGLVLLVRHDALTAASRAAGFRQAKTLWTCTWRTRWIEGSTGNGRWSNVWVHWQAGASGPPVSHWIKQIELRQARLQFPEGEERPQ
jgi:hypothetical protein